MAYRENCKPNETKRIFKFEKEDTYNPKVLLGAWPERISSYIKQYNIHDTTYNTDFQTNQCTYDRNRIWDNKGRGQGLDKKLLFDYHGPCFLENFTSTSDLTYNHIPKMSEKGKVMKDTLDCYGNATKYGLLDYKRAEWWEDSLDPRRTAITTHEATYTEHSLKDLPPMDIPSWKKKICNPITGECIVDNEKQVYRCSPPKKEVVKTEMPKMCLVQRN